MRKLLLIIGLFVFILSSCSGPLEVEVSFETNGGSTINSMIFNEESEFSLPNDPVKEGYTFSGWFLDATFDTPFSVKGVIALEPEESLNVYAQWSINAYTITFDSDGGTEVSAITQDYATDITAPADPTREGYTFNGWDADIPATIPAGDLTLTATWTINQYTITFDSDGGTEVSAITQDYATDITAPADPTREGYTFNGWDADIPATIPASDLIFKANWVIDDSYFYGNVFQIITYDLGKIPISTGSGFIFNSDGWFISNAHVFEGAYFSDAFFNIIDYSEGSNYTKLEIDLISYYSNSKDLIIGKITNYSKISQEFYKNIEFHNGYEIGDITYSVGYPYSSIELEVNKGVIIEDISSLSDKVISGISYIGSTSFIAPGSSGGVLLNENLDVIGITTIGLYLNDDFILGGSIETLNFSGVVSQQTEEILVDISEKLNPNEIDFIRLIKTLYDSQANNLEVILFENYRRFVFRWKTDDTNNSDVAYIYEEVLAIDTDGYIQYYSEVIFENGDKRNEEFYGLYSSNILFDSFTYKFTYKFASGTSYSLTSTNINYSENINLTLFDYSLTNTPSTYVVSTSNIEYAKRLFNATYLWLYSWIYE